MNLLQGQSRLRKIIGGTRSIRKTIREVLQETTTAAAHTARWGGMHWRLIYHRCHRRWHFDFANGKRPFERQVASARKETTALSRESTVFRLRRLCGFVHQVSTTDAR